ncbi:MAG: hypothetical protein ACTS44_01265 [Candidatus Hodgkinia cicadicola]
MVVRMVSHEVKNRVDVRTSALRRLAPAEGLRLIERWIVDKWNAISVEVTWYFGGLNGGWVKHDLRSGYL